MSTKIACAWLPNSSNWQSFVDECGLAEAATAAGDKWVQTHREAVDALVSELQAAIAGEGRHAEAWLIMSPPELAQRVAPEAELRTQQGRAAAAERLAEQSQRILGLTVDPKAIGAALIQEPRDDYQLRTLEVRGNVKIMTAATVGGEAPF